MTRSTLRWRSAAALTAAATTLVACGGGGEQAATSASSAAASVASGAASAASGAASAASSAAASVAGSASASAAAPPPAPVAPDQQLVIGTLLPQTGSLAFLGPPEFAGVKLAAQEINAAGGVLGKDVRVVDGDSGDTSTNIASQTVDRLISEKADAIVGAASSSVTLSVIDKVTQANVLQISPANTSDELTDYNDKNLYFRTAPPDKLQGRVLADEILADGHQTLGILALSDSYGEGLSNNLKQFYEEGGGQVVEQISYDPKAPSFAAEVGRIKAANPDAIAVVAFDETKKIIPEMVTQGVGPQAKQLYFVDGNLADYSKDFPPNTLAPSGGNPVKGTLPGARSGESLQQRLKQVDPALKDYSYGPESYDATVLVALAAEAAKSDGGPAIAEQMQAVSSGGTKCTSFRQCKGLLDDGANIDYEGQSGPVSFDDNGNPSEATIGIYRYSADNTYKNQKYETGRVGG